jgi:hypothetical protein
MNIKNTKTRKVTVIGRNDMVLTIKQSPGKNVSVSYLRMLRVLLSSISGKFQLINIKRFLLTRFKPHSMSKY